MAADERERTEEEIVDAAEDEFDDDELDDDELDEEDDLEDAD